MKRFETPWICCCRCLNVLLHKTSSKILRSMLSTVTPKRDEVIRLSKFYVTDYNHTEGTWSTRWTTYTEEAPSAGVDSSRQPIRGMQAGINLPPATWHCDVPLTGLNVTTSWPLVTRALDHHCLFLANTCSTGVDLKTTQVVRHGAPSQ